MKGVGMAMLLPTTKLLGKCFACGRNFKKGMLLDAAVIDKLDRSRFVIRAPENHMH